MVLLYQSILSGILMGLEGEIPGSFGVYPNLQCSLEVNKSKKDLLVIFISFKVVS